MEFAGSLQLKQLWVLSQWMAHNRAHMAAQIRLRVTNNKERGNEVVGTRRALGECVVGGE